MTVEIQSEYLQQTLIDLVKIDSINPELTPTGAGETEIAQYVV